MFGHQNDQTAPQTNPAITPVEPPADDAFGSTTASAPALQAPVSPYGAEVTPDEADNPALPPATPFDAEAAPAASIAPTPAATPSDNVSPISGDDDLLTLKQQALTQLSPLVGHLDQSPEEKLRTTMMLIQASDNQHLIKDAYEAAQSITDEKTRAQALLDIVNEINYFTQQKEA